MIILFYSYKLNIILLKTIYDNIIKLLINIKNKNNLK